MKAVLTANKKRELLKKGWSQEDVRALEIQLDPVLWAETNLKNPDDPAKPLKLRWYQKEMLRCPDKKKVFRLGRRCGKSITLCVEMLWKAFNNSHRTVLVCTPYKNQVAQLWKDGFHKLIKGNEFIEGSITRMGQNPWTIEWTNESRILGLTAGSKTGNKGSAIRGQNATDLYLDEVDYMGDEAIQSIMAIIATRRDTRFVISSTPTGRREFYYEACTNKKLGYQEFHYPSSASPEWISIEEARKQRIPLHESQEFIFRNQNPEHVYAHEYLAEFGEEAEGVFKHRLIDNSLFRYKNEEFDSKGRYWSCGDKQDKENVYILGVDWNGEKHGTQFVLLEYMRKATPVTYIETDQDGKDCEVTDKFEDKYRVFYRESVSIHEMTQLESIKKVVELNSKFKIDHIYVDAGYGTTNIEELKLYGKKNLQSGLARKLVPINFQGKVEVLDPFTKEKEKKDIKPFMVFNAQACLERGQFMLPENEDEKVKLVGQMREYRIEKMSALGVPKFSTENDHVLDAFILAVLGFQLEYSELVQTPLSSTVLFSKKPNMLLKGTESLNDRTIEDRKDDPLSKHGVAKRGPRLEAQNFVPDKRGSYMDYEDLIKTPKKTGTPFSSPVFKTGWSQVGAPTRKMF